MPITIKGIRVKSITITRDDEGGDAVACTYELISSTDKVLAKQALSNKSGYGESPFAPPSDTMKLIGDAVAKYKADIEAHLGLT